FSFPLAAFTVLTLRLAELSESHTMQTAGVLMLAVTSVAILWLGFSTVRGLREGSLLAPEPVANIVPTAG
ncbi:MAG: C4-dicarboxylate ABC transporter, partial [Hydrogenophaga sp.]|nr:C4-dicarboxylate ABC transporter [Hydrogenophaga sp.]